MKTLGKLGMGRRPLGMRLETGRGPTVRNLECQAKRRTAKTTGSQISKSDFCHKEN